MRFRIGPEFYLTDPGARGTARFWMCWGSGTLAVMPPVSAGNPVEEGVEGLAGGRFVFCWASFLRLKSRITRLTYACVS